MDDNQESRTAARHDDLEPVGVYEARQFFGEVDAQEGAPEGPTLPNGEYRVVAGTLYRILPGAPPQLRDNHRMHGALRRAEQDDNTDFGCDTLRWDTASHMGALDQDGQAQYNAVSGQDDAGAEPKCKCYDCGLAYDDPGFQDLLVPDEVWAKISPTGNEGGVLCPTCLVRAAKKVGLENTLAVFRSGPFAEPSTPPNLDDVFEALHMEQRRPGLPDETYETMRRAASLLHNYSDAAARLRAENKHLRGLEASTGDDAYNHKWDADEIRLELKRAQGLFVDLELDNNVLRHERDAARAENDRLRQGLDAGLRREAAELRREEKLRRQLAEVEAENDRLRPELEASQRNHVETINDRNDWYQEAIRLRRRLAEIESAYNECGVHGIYDTFDGPAEAIRQMAQYIKENDDGDGSGWRGRRIAELEEALQHLYDEQNGPPLLRREQQWYAAVDRARRLLEDAPMAKLRTDERQASSSNMTKKDLIVRAVVQDRRIAELEEALRIAARWIETGGAQSGWSLDRLYEVLRARRVLAEGEGEP